MQATVTRWEVVKFWTKQNKAILVRKLYRVAHFVVNNVARPHGDPVVNAGLADVVSQTVHNDPVKRELELWEESLEKDDEVVSGRIKEGGEVIRATENSLRAFCP